MKIIGHLLLSSALFSGCGSSSTSSSSEENLNGSGAPAQQSAFVKVSADILSPQYVHIKLGGTVTWTNMDNQPHQLVSGDAGNPGTGSLFDSDVLLAPSGFQPFRRFTVTFASAGTVDYFCAAHPGTLVGQIVVGP